MEETKNRFSWAGILKSLNGTKDMTDGKPLKLILGFGLPLLLSV